jgi:hypothetical protein
MLFVEPLIPPFDWTWESKFTELAKKAGAKAERSVKSGSGSKKRFMSIVIKDTRDVGVDPYPSDLYHSGSGVFL